MGSLKSLAQGFLVATGLIWIFNIVVLIKGGDAWLGLLYFLILVIPVSSLTYLKLKKTNPQATRDTSAKWRYLLFSFQGVALAFWMFDIATTFYAINVTGLATELNPLGWPLGILGAFTYYGPTLICSYVLLFKIKESISFYSAILLTLVTLGMGTMNLVAGAQNFQVFVDTAAIATGIRYGLLALVVSVNLAVPLALKRMATQRKIF
ncbi:hypothetical protein MUP42_03310 [Candidatus Bathyarchaeota archaeon]|nr:hypothetical protein [Candidatus Bathyarchaeota archaeon]